MNGDIQVRFRERPGGKFPGPTRLADTVRGAEASANLYTVIETAKVNGIEPYAYLRHVFAELPKATTLEDVEALLPGRVDREQIRIANP